MIEDKLLQALIEKAGALALAERDRDGMTDALGKASNELRLLRDKVGGLEHAIKNREHEVTALRAKADIAEKPIVELYEAAQNLLNVLATEHGRKRAPRTADGCDRLQRAIHAAFPHLELIPF